ncbi:MAG: MucR family transcriptional regulator [Robiginitomaculum sp.]|nr:MAG: MucR family transcriptional regulator [Robiginitomaculum sp.]
MGKKGELLGLTTQIVAAYVGNNKLSTEDLPDLVGSVFASLSNVEAGSTLLNGRDNKPAVPIGKSVFDDHIICLEDGQKFKSLKRHLKAKYNLSPDDYRQKWSLPATYPMVAPEYARTRSALARQIGLGRGQRKKV